MLSQNYPIKVCIYCIISTKSNPPPSPSVYVTLCNDEYFIPHSLTQNTSPVHQAPWPKWFHSWNATSSFATGVGASRSCSKHCCEIKLGKYGCKIPAELLYIVILDHRQNMWFDKTSCFCLKTSSNHINAVLYLHFAVCPDISRPMSWNAGALRVPML